MQKKHKLYVGTNLKMFKTAAQTAAYISKLRENIADILAEQRANVFVIPSFLAIESAQKAAAQNGLRIGAQNMSWLDEGEHTGEVSPVMLEEFGIGLIELGHSERRNVFGETDEMLGKKVCAGLAHNFTVLLCVGENAAVRDAGQSDEFIRAQLEKGFQDVAPENARRIWVAYEPVWAIGVAGVPAAPDYIAARHAGIAAALADIFGARSADIPILYGGSVNAQNAREYYAQDHVDGLFIGRAAWDANNFDGIIRDLLNG